MRVKVAAGTTWVKSFRARIKPVIALRQRVRQTCDARVGGNRTLIFAASASRTER